MPPAIGSSLCLVTPWLFSTCSSCSEEPAVHPVAWIGWPGLAVAPLSLGTGSTLGCTGVLLDGTAAPSTLRAQPSPVVMASGVGVWLARAALVVRPALGGIGGKLPVCCGVEEAAGGGAGPSSGS